jgi:hypothetical protein
VDLVVEGRGGRRIAVEVKRSTAPEASRRFRQAREDLEVAAAAVVHGGGERYPLGPSVEAVAASEAADWLREKLG